MIQNFQSKVCQPGWCGGQRAVHCNNCLHISGVRPALQRSDISSQLSSQVHPTTCQSPVSAVCLDSQISAHWPRSDIAQPEPNLSLASHDEPAQAQTTVLIIYAVLLCREQPSLHICTLSGMHSAVSPEGNVFTTLLISSDCTSRPHNLYL